MWSQDCNISNLSINRQPQRVGKAFIFNPSSFSHVVPLEPDYYSGYNNRHHSYLRSFKHNHQAFFSLLETRPQGKKLTLELIGNSKK
ncbi:hypothetical protein IMY05_018G0102000 [Salix suchowensis]|nr:hypothetical protein IMY05_018G0102000 [Salix suchowensis]